MNHPERSHQPTAERDREHPASGRPGLLAALVLGSGGFLLVTRGAASADLCDAMRTG
jgi:hypothetical protein